MRLNSHPSGRHFLQIPGPTNVPDRILRAMDYPTIDHRGPEFNALAKKVLRSVRQVFQTKQPVIVYPASGTGAWEAALVKTRSGGDLVLMWATGHCASHEGSKRAGRPPRVATLPRAFGGWDDMRAASGNACSPYRRATTLFCGRGEPCERRREKGRASVCARHARHAEATRTAVTAW